MLDSNSFPFLYFQVTIGAEIDVEDVRSYRNYMKSRCVMASRKKSFPRVTVDFSLGADEEGAPVMLERADWELLTAEQEIRYVLLRLQNVRSYYCYW